MAGVENDGGAARVKTEAAVGFGNRGSVEAYESARPSYPAEAVAYLVGYGEIGPGTQVVDLAAGTGKLTRLLVPSGAEVVAVEPVAAMRDQLVESVPGLEVLDGTAEALPFPDDSLDVITTAQAFHWFDPPAAVAEMARVLKPGGSLFLVWNQRDKGTDWVEQFGDLLDVDPELARPYDLYYDVDYAAVVEQAQPGRFHHVGTYRHRWEQPCDEDLLVARAASVSVVGALPEDRRRVVLDRVRQLVRTHPDLAGRAWFSMPYVTEVWNFILRDG